MDVDLRQDLGHAVDVGLATDEHEIGKGARFRDQMFAAAEPNFEPDFIGRWVEHVNEIGRAGASDVERKPRRQTFAQIGLTRAELVALPPPEERTVRGPGTPLVARRLALRSSPATSPPPSLPSTPRN